MTLIVGLKCEDGIVLGADSAATLGDVTGLTTVLQPVSKLHIVRNQAVLGVSGPVGIGQMYLDRLGGVVPRIRDQNPVTAARMLRDAFLEDAQVALKVTAMAQQVVGAATAGRAVLHSTVVAVAPNRRPELIQFDYLCSPEIATNDLPFVTIGSGKNLADPFLAFIRQIFWPTRLPTLAEGRFAVM